MFKALKKAIIQRINNNRGKFMPTKGPLALKTFRKFSLSGDEWNMCEHNKAEYSLFCDAAARAAKTVTGQIPPSATEQHIKPNRITIEQKISELVRNEYENAARDPVLEKLLVATLMAVSEYFVQLDFAPYQHLVDDRWYSHEFSDYWAILAQRLTKIINNFKSIMEKKERIINKMCPGMETGNQFGNENKYLAPFVVMAYIYQNRQMGMKGDMVDDYDFGCYLHSTGHGEGNMYNLNLEDVKFLTGIIQNSATRNSLFLAAASSASRSALRVTMSQLINTLSRNKTKVSNANSSAQIEKSQRPSSSNPPASKLVFS